MNNLAKLKSLRQKIYQDTTSNFGEHLQLFYEGNSLLLDASDILVSTEKVSDHHTADGASKTATWRFVSTLPTSLYWCCEIAVSGDYGIAKNILRLSLEEFVKLAYYSTFPDKALRQVVRDRDSDEIDLGDMLKQLELEHRSGILRLYGDLSAFYSHANFNLPRELVFEEPEKQIQIGGGPRFSPDLFEPIIQQLIIIVANSIKYVVIRFPYLIDDKVWMGRFEEFVPKAADVLPD
ncbi:MAG: hypothetical protein FJZ96_08035 [Chloroflexi bacterium]|nr:hypothetical protein [Chloroflexota bacterium]